MGVRKSLLPQNPLSPPTKLESFDVGPTSLGTRLSQRFPRSLRACCLPLCLRAQKCSILTEETAEARAGDPAS